MPGCTDIKGAAQLLLRSRPPLPLEAEGIRVRADALVRRHEYTEAHENYLEALDLEPLNSILLVNLAIACWLLDKWDEGHDNITMAARHDPENVLVQDRCLRYLLCMGRLTEAQEICAARPQRPDDDAEWSAFVAYAEKVTRDIRKFRDIAALLADHPRLCEPGNADACAAGLGEVLGLLGVVGARTPFGVRVRTMLVKAQVASNDCPTASFETAREALQSAQLLAAEHPESPEPLYWSARALLRLTRRTAAQDSLREAVAVAGGAHPASGELLTYMRLAERHKAMGNAAFQRRDWAAAEESYSVAMCADEGCLDPSFMASLFCNRSAVRQKRGLTAAAFEDVKVALALLPSYAKALFRRGVLHMELERYREAVQDFDAVAKLCSNFEGLESWRAKARHAAAKPPAKNLYAQLGVSRDADQREIRRAYRSAALRWHPDKNPENQDEAETVFKRIQQAFEVLSDPRRRRDYDGAAMRGSSGGPQAGSTPAWRGPAAQPSAGYPPGWSSMGAFRTGSQGLFGTRFAF